MLSLLLMAAANELGIADMSDEVIGIRVSDASRRSGLSDWQIRQAIARKNLRAIQVGKTWLIDPRSLERMLSFEPPEAA
jgi:hypothetical protein